MMGSLLKSTRNTRVLPGGDGRYIRSDYPGRLTDGEVDWLRQNGVTTIVDLREKDEYERRKHPQSSGCAATRKKEADRMILAANKTGIRLEAFFPTANEDELAGYQPLTGAFAVIRVDGKWLLGYNKQRGQWEFPAGKIEPNETPREAAKRELYEETHQTVSDLSLRGVFKIFDAKRSETRYRALYFGELGALAPFAAKDGDEMEKIMLWDGREDIGYVDEVDIKMSELAMSRD